MIPVTKPYLPSIDKYQQHLEGIYQRNWLTNNGPLVQELTSRLSEHLGVQNLLLVTNGTLALQVALKALKVPASSHVVSTPFTFAATPCVLDWEGHTPCFADIDLESFNLSPTLMEQQLKSNSAIMPVHVFGNPCDVNQIERLAKDKKSKVIYDACHAFGVKYQGQSLLNFGDAATLSFHATKLYHTVEGGAIVFKNADDLEYAKQLINFGLDANGQGMPETVGLNAKMSEFHAAMGLAMLDDIDTVQRQRLAIIEQYQQQLAGVVSFQVWPEDVENNGAYMPVLFDTEQQLHQVVEGLNATQVFPRRYFYPSLNVSQAFKNGQSCPVSESVALRILCLPLYVGLEEGQVSQICTTLKAALHA